MYLFQLNLRLSWMQLRNYIYIPLCIYFNLHHRYKQGIEERYLHSTMYLFQHHLLCCAYNLHIYLHSTMYLFQPKAVLKPAYLWRNLHSTMYLFQLCSHMDAVDLPPYLHSTMYLFQQEAFNQMTLLNKNLHSTMYLFQPPRNRTMLNLGIIYIPLCIYFNGRRT